MSTETNTPKPTAPAFTEPEWKTAAREWETSAKAARNEFEELTAKYAELEAQNGELTAKVAALDLDAARAALLDKVATATGVPAEVLRGDTEAELTAHATIIKGLM